MQPTAAADHLADFYAKIQSLDDGISLAGLADYARKLRALA
ncbi:MAG TPA: hypothetical protein VF172_02390 [Nitrososphaera sp.]